MKTSLFNIIRRQKKLVNLLIFLISWSQIHAQANSLFLSKEERSQADRKYTERYIKKTGDQMKAVTESADPVSEGDSDTPEDYSVVADPETENRVKVPVKTIVNASTTFHNAKSKWYISDIKQGIIGKDKKHPIDQVYDNIFTVTINDALKPGFSAWLEYDLYGITQASGVSKYINDELATGGDKVGKNNEWSNQSEALPISAVQKGKNTITFTIPADADYTYQVRNVRIRIDRSQAPGYQAEKNISLAVIKSFVAGEAGKLNMDGAALEVAQGVLKNTQNFSVTPLRDIDAPVTAPELINVTQQHFGYRFLPHGEHFTTPAKVTMKYDASKIPAGYTEQDVRAFYFDGVQKKWLALEKDSLVGDQQLLISKTTHFTDMITGVIKVPESPETGSYAPNSIKDIKAADPSSGIVNIGAPSPNNMGTVNTGFPIKLPAGRQGMQPSLSVGYSSEGGNGWMGIGWDLSVPAINIDTRWGVPRYDAAKETEIYSFGGEQLTFKEGDKFVLPNRAEGFDKARTSDRQFYPRIEGAYNKIIRHGSSPANYWWEVISKDGTKNYFGGDGTAVVENAVLRQPGTNNIGHWTLYRTIDTNGNYVEYTYDKTPYSGNPGNGAQEQVISKIQYTLHTTQNPAKNYSVQFTTESGRKDVQLNARLGFVQATSKKLSKIDITYGSEPVRSYDFKYKEGAFYKTLLESITEKGTDGKEFYTNKIEYFNHVANGLFGTSDKVNIPTPIAKTTPLSNSVAKSSSFGLAATVGLAKGKDLAPMLKSATIGPNSQFSTGRSFGQTAMVDLDGDGLADQVYAQDGSNSFNYVKNKTDKTSINFGGGQTNIANSAPFSTNKSLTSSFGIEATAGTLITGNLTLSTFSERTVTQNYLADVNNDGIMDIVDKGKVLFGYIENGVLQYSDSSAKTPNPINSGSFTSTPDPNEEKEVRQQSPLLDIVKVWKAPYSGTINVTGTAQLDAGSSDGVQLMVQHKANELQRNNLAAGASQDISISGRSINKGEYLYFRVSSIDNGTKDLLKLDAKIEYTHVRNIAGIQTQVGTHNTEIRYDENLGDYYIFNLKDDYLFNDKAGFGAPFTSKLKITGNFVKPATSDKLSIIVTKSDAEGNNISTVYSKTFDRPEQTETLDISVDATEGDTYHVTLKASSNIDWPKVQLNNLKATFTGTVDGDAVTADFYPTADRQFYNWARKGDSEDVIFPAQPVPNVLLSKVSPYLTLKNTDAENPFPGNVLVSVKRYTKEGKLLDTTDKTLPINGHTESNYDAEPVELTTLSPNDTFYTFVSYYLESAEQLNRINVASYREGQSHSTNVFVPDNDNSVGSDGNDPPAFHTDKINDGRFGPMYKNWGQFSYNGGWGNYANSENPKWDNQPIDEEVLNIDTSDANNTDPGTSTAKPAYEQRWFQLMPFVGINPENPESTAIIQRYQGNKANVYVEERSLSTSRLGIDDAMEMLGGGSNSGSGHFAPLKVSKNTGTSAGGGVGAVTVNFGASVGKSRTINISNYQDLNGDGYPDALTNTNSQYTNMLGGYSDTTGSSAINGAQYVSLDRGSTKGFSAGNSYPIPFKSDSNSKTGLAASNPGFNLGAGTSTNDDYTEYDLYDINGDGLPDRVFRDGKVGLNVGYSFLEPEVWSYGAEFRKGRAEVSNFNAGVSSGKSLFNGSISFGYNGSSTDGQQLEQLIDINGDGLPDKIEGNTIKLNTGNGFITYEAGQLPFISKINAEGKSLNFAVSVCPAIPISPTTFLKICINPSFNTGSSFSNVTHQISDLDGDGFPDLLVGDINKNVEYRLSQIGTTNLLKKVTLPMGGNWEVSYERKGNTYDLPQTKWVMTSVITNDGFTGDSQFKPDVSKITVTYENPYHSRRERAFYGFEKVRTNQINTENGGASATEIFRYTLQTFNNTSYFLKGALLSEVLFDANNKKWTEKINTLSLRNINNTSVVAANVLAKEEEKGLNNYGYFLALDKTTSNFYEGQTVAGKSTSIEMTYDNYGSLKQNKDLGDVQIGNTEVLTSDITYQITNNGSSYLILPSRIKSTAAGVTRERTAAYDTKGNLTGVTMVGPGNPVNNYDYDIYGNIKKATGPANAQGERFYHEYTYDSEVVAYPEMVKDAFGYSSSSQYDFRFGVPVYTEDMNLQPTQYAYDNFGRSTEITGPYEMFHDIPWTIQFEYKPITDAPLNATGAQSYAVTRHYDPDNAGNTINTVSISDGLGSPVQVKKTADIHQKGVRYVVSGKVKQDAFGRALKTYYPTEGAASSYTYDPTVDNIVPTINTYDVMDRVLSTKLPDEDLIAEVQYSFGNDRDGRQMFKTVMTDELGTIKKTYVDMKGRTTTVHEPSDTGDIFTSFTHNAIGELLRVKDVQNNLTTSVYDDLGRRTSMTHPDNGTSAFTYDAASNMTSRTTAENETVTYEYDFRRLKAINYPKYPENNVKYYYGKAQDASAMDNNAVGRLWYQTDATGSQYMKYGRLGELTYQRRSVAAPGAGVYWFGTEWEYDTWNRVKTITYPDGEKVTYRYNLAGNMKSMASEKDGFARNMIDNMGYDKFEQRVYLKNGNGTVTNYEYETKRRRLLKLDTQTPGNRYFMRNLYQYDVVSNVVQIRNNAPVAQAGLLGGGTTYSYGYDDLYRLTSANGNWRGRNAQGQEERQRYTVTMAYDNMHNIMSKTQKHERAMGNTGNAWNTIDPSSYRLNYKYEGSKPHAPSTIIDEPNVAGSLCCDEDNPQVKFQNYTYDKKGNPKGIAQQTCKETEPKTKYRWDEENRLRFVDTNPSTPEVDGSAIYTYDAGGERIIKNVLSSTSVKGSDGNTETVTKNDYTLYPNGMAVARIVFDFQTQKYDLSYTKHYYAGSQRINSKLGKGKDVGLFNCAWLIIPLGGGQAVINEKTVAKEKLDANTAASLAIMADNGITPPPNYGQNAGYNENCVSSYKGEEEKDTYWYHPDHLGSSSFITGLDGEVTQNIEYFPSGEVFVENHKNSYNTPYKFNGKELDDETGYYYYGARYYNPRVSLWLNVDPFAEYNPFMNDQAYIDGQHNGGVYNSGNLSPYIYTYNSPVKYIDPNGKQVESFATNDGVKNLVIVNLGYDGQNRQRGTTQNISPDDGLVNIVSTGPSLKVVYYASSATDSTKKDITGTINNFRKAHPKGQVILIGHSGGADNNIELLKENSKVKVNLLITLDARDPDKFGWTDTNIPSNAENAINYYQNTDPLNFVSDRKMDFNSKTKGVNILSPGSNHRSIDNDQYPNIIQDINNQLGGRDAVDAAKNRKQNTYSPDRSSNVISK